MKDRILEWGEFEDLLDAFEQSNPRPKQDANLVCTTWYVRDNKLFVHLEFEVSKDLPEKIEISPQSYLREWLLKRIVKGSGDV